MSKRRGEYAELLRDPRWQRKRLEIMQRDGFACQDCGDTSKTLNVHHKSYRRGCLPWEYENSNLVTLCEDCHYREGFRLVRIDQGGSCQSEDDVEQSVWFRVGDGLLETGANNGCYHWAEPDKASPNARVSAFFLAPFEPPLDGLDYDQRAQLIRIAIDGLRVNLGPGDGNKQRSHPPYVVKEPDGIYGR